MQHPGKNWLHDFLPYIIYRLSSKMRQDIKKQINRHGLDNTNWRILTVLDSEGSCSITELTNITLMQQPTVSRVIDRLEIQGLLKRSTFSSDSRRQNISLSKKGKEIIGQIIPKAFDKEDGALVDFSSLEIRTLKSYLKRIGKNIELNDI